jgi:serine/threonine protein phosphatase PrpC
MSSWRIAFASATGTSHLKLNKGCDDSCTAEILTSEEDEVVILCVADGAGTASRSAEGAQEVCNCFLRICKTIFESGSAFSGATERTIREDWIAQLRDALVSKACDEASELRDFATTFLGAVLADDHCIFCKSEMAQLLRAKYTLQKTTPSFVGPNMGSMQIRPAF